MKLLYATSIRYPSALANRIQVMAMAGAFAKQLGSSFYLGGNEIKSTNSELQIVNFHLKKSWRLSWRCLLFAKKECITHIYCREARLLFFIVFYNFIFFRLPLWIGYEVHALLGRSRIDYLTDAALSFFVDLYFFTTNQLRNLYNKKYQLKEKRSIVLPDAVDLSIFDIPLSVEKARRQLGWSIEAKIIGFCGRFKTLSMDKGIDDILSALQLLPSEIRFVAVGGSDEDIAEYKEKAAVFDLVSRTEFLGHVTQNELAIYQKAFDILLMPFPWQNHFAYYMSPLKMFEYMATGRPIITTDLPSIREILNEHNALIVPPNRPIELADAIKVLYANLSLGEEIAKTANKDAQKYSWLQRAQKVIDNIIGSRATI